ncbi:hypothetical protein [uncultured Enterococcus sp.]|uniref:hypothetical protein n=1 Tax=uncultured Enterococcus sp. TaxID=167972 RepID=UPI002AA8D574|nr:hypothetical protein [uncultured Enterococcus sp.]
MNLKSNEDVRQWLKDNLIDKRAAIEITQQTERAFRQSVDTKQITPFFELDGSTSSKIRLFLKSEVEEYAKNKRK